METVGIGPSSVSRWVLEEPAVGHSSRPPGTGQRNGRVPRCHQAGRARGGSGLAVQSDPSSAAPRAGARSSLGLQGSSARVCEAAPTGGISLPQEPKAAVLSRVSPISFTPPRFPCPSQPGWSLSRQPALSRAELFFPILRATARSWERSCGCADPVSRGQSKHCPGALAVPSACRLCWLFSWGLDEL